LLLCAHRIAIRALNHQRRKEPLKWSKCPTCQAPIDYSLHEQHVAGFDQVPTLLLNHTTLTRAVLAAAVAAAALIAAVQLQWLYVRLLISGFFWKRIWPQCEFLLRLPLPLWILAAQTLRVFVAQWFARLEHALRDYLTETESSVFERVLPETVTAADAAAELGE
jgi:hypothetical protein